MGPLARLEGPPRPRLPLLAALFAAMLLASGCGEGESDTRGGGGGTTTQEVVCPRGAVPGPDGACMPAGIQGCADMFWEEDNLCHPSSEKCPAGTIPKFDEGCIPVGVPDCAPEFAQEGVCAATLTKCPQGTFAAPQEGCVPVDGPEGCGQDPWGHVVESGGDVHVHQSALPGGDGSRDAPFQTIADALQVAGSGGRVVIAAGNYNEPILITEDIEVVGRCPSMVKVTGVQSFGGVPAIVVLDHTMGASVRNLAVGGNGIGILAYYAHDTTIEGVAVEQATGYGLQVLGGNAGVTRSWIHKTAQLQGNFGDGAVAGFGAELTIERSAITASRRLALLATGKNVLVGLEDSLVEPVLAPGDKGPRNGLVAQDGATLDITDSVVVGARAWGVKLLRAGTTSSIFRSEVRDTLAEEGTGELGDGVEVEDAAALTLTGSVLFRNRRSGLLAEKGGVATLDATLVTKSGADENNSTPWSFGVVAQEASIVNLLRSVVSDVAGAGLRASSEGTVLSMEASAIEGSGFTQANQYNERGAQVDSGTLLTASGSYFSNNASAGLVVFSPGTTAALDHCLFEKTRPDAAKQYGVGLVTMGGGLAESTASAFVANEMMGVRAQGSGSVWTSTSDYLAGDPAQSLGVLFDDKASGSLTGAVLAHHRGFAALVYTASVSITGCRIEYVKSASMKLADQSYDNIGDGLLVMQGSTVNVSGLLVNDFARTAVLFDESAGSISGTHTTRGLFGLVLQGTVQPTLGDNNGFEGSEQGIVRSGALPVPDQPAPIPTPP